MSTYFQSNLYTWDSAAQAAYLSITSSNSANDKFISYDDEHAGEAKVSRATLSLVGWGSWATAAVTRMTPWL